MPRKPNKETHWVKEGKKLKFFVGRAANMNGARAAAREFGVSRGQARYWGEKLTNPFFHCGEWEGEERYDNLYSVMQSFVC
jgi:hypothetical protein